MMTEPTPLAAFARRRALARGLSHNAAWRPGLGVSSLYCELFASGNEAAGSGLALALALDQMGDRLKQDDRPFLWVQDKAALRLSGRPYCPGLPPALRHRLIHVAAQKAEDALFALEEGLRCRDLAFVLGELAGNPRALSFTASRRLALVAERHGVPLWLVRLDAARDLSAARMRWQVSPAPSAPPQWNPAAPGRPAWQGALFRARAYPSGQWTLRDEGHALVARPGHHATYPVDLVQGAGDRSLAAG